MTRPLLAPLRKDWHGAALKAIGVRHVPPVIDSKSLSPLADAGLALRY